MLIDSKFPAGEAAILQDIGIFSTIRFLQTTFARRAASLPACICVILTVITSCNNKILCCKLESWINIVKLGIGQIYRQTGYLVADTEWSL